MRDVSNTRAFTHTMNTWTLSPTVLQVLGVISGSLLYPTTDLQVHGLVIKPSYTCIRKHLFSKWPIIDVDFHPKKFSFELIIMFPKQHYKNLKQSIKYAFNGVGLQSRFNHISLQDIEQGSITSINIILSLYKGWGHVDNSPWLLGVEPVQTISQQQKFFLRALM